MAQRTGYLFVDHRASPGLPEDVARASGYDPLHCKEGKLFEADTLTCAHCRTGVVKNPLRTRERASCFKCGHHYICDICAAQMLHPDYDHTPFERLVDVGVELAHKGQPLGSSLDLMLGRVKPL